MKSYTIIKSIISGFLLCVFALGITPKQVLHDVLTNHQHLEGKKNEAWISKDRFNCDDENLVAQSAFVDQDNTVTIILPLLFNVVKNLFSTSYTYLHQYFSNLRGPPFFA